MDRFNLALCLVPRAAEAGVEYFPEDELRLALGGIAARADHIVSYATPHRIAAAIASNVRAAPEFTHQVNMLIGNTVCREALIELLCDLTSSEHMDSDKVPLQCMIFASDEASVVCEIIGREEMKSVEEVICGMHQIVLVALKYGRRTVTFVVAEQLSTTLIASMLGSSWCHLWLFLGGNDSIDQSVSMLREALAVRDAVNGFRHSSAPLIREKEDIEALLQARASSDGEAKQLMKSFQRFILEEDAHKEFQQIVDENAVLQAAQADLQLYLTEREEYFTRRLEETEQEIEYLREKLQESTTKVKEIGEKEARIIELETQLAKKNEELFIQQERAFTNQQEAEKQIQQLNLEHNITLKKIQNMDVSHKVENSVGSLQSELLKAQAALRDLQQQLDDLNEENLQNVMEFQAKEKNWQKELKQEKTKREVAIKECLQLQTVINSQGSSMDVVNETIQASLALQEQELDDLLLKVRAISSANASIVHRCVSPQRLANSNPRNRIRVLSPTTSLNGNSSL
ncbi:hypothetical protein LSM04_006436 [Trypanosoma melophagium]|uniref:uncharacterized protein n=1 Tax=Trypanosoma melophagium TaxID=715481 RepID=UPI00351A0206|nr:hypothetical protein LSM04_006436 [Trypanosoma melophagium]